MAKDIIPQELLIYRRVCTNALNIVTNEMYAGNNKISFSYSFTRVPSENKPSVFVSSAKPLYLFSVIALDKSNNPIGIEIRLYSNYYPKDTLVSVYQLEQRAIMDWVTNSWKALYNLTQEEYMERAKANQKILDERLAKGITPETIKADIAKRDAGRIAKQEADIMKLMHPDIK